MPAPCKSGIPAVDEVDAACNVDCPDVTPGPLRPVTSDDLVHRPGLAAAAEPRHRCEHTNAHVGDAILDFAHRVKADTRDSRLKIE